jgi:hypothetical protein
VAGPEELGGEGERALSKILHIGQASSRKPWNMHRSNMFITDDMECYLLFLVSKIPFTFIYLYDMLGIKSNKTEEYYAQ